MATATAWEENSEFSMIVALVATTAGILN